MGGFIDKFLPESVQDLVGGTVAETGSHGSENLSQFYFGRSSPPGADYRRGSSTSGILETPHNPVLVGVGA
jgi:hypothetical protein